jgi:hypothetical protein
MQIVSLQHVSLTIEAALLLMPEFDITNHKNETAKKTDTIMFLKIPFSMHFSIIAKISRNISYNLDIDLLEQCGTKKLHGQNARGTSHTH